MMSIEERDELISAFVDGEQVSASELLDALSAPQALTTLRAYLELRAHLQATEQQPSEDVSRRLARRLEAANGARRQRGWLTAAVFVLALAGAWLAGAWLPVPWLPGPWSEDHGSARSQQLSRVADPASRSDGRTTARRQLRFQPGVDWHPQLPASVSVETRSKVRGSPVAGSPTPSPSDREPARQNPARQDPAHQDKENCA